MLRMINKRVGKSCGVVSGMLFTLALFPLAWIFSTFPGDEQAILGVEGLHTGWLNTLALGVTKLGSFPFTAVMLIGVVTLLLANRRRVDGIIMALTVVPMASGFLLKVLVDRARPDFFTLGSQPGTMSFPSGHSVFAVLFFGVLLVLVEDLVESRLIRRTLQVGLGLLILSVGASRVYLGVHWPSDVIGGYLFGAMSLLGLIWLRGRLLTGPSPAAVPAY